jgi:O-antigen ligase
MNVAARTQSRPRTSTTPAVWIIHALIGATFFLAGSWKALPQPPALYTPTYALGFWCSAAACVTGFAWCLAGAPGLRRLLANRWAAGWLVLFAVFGLWALLSQHWAFQRADRPGIAHSAAVQILVVWLFCVVVLCTRPPPRLVFAGLALAMALNTLVGLGQFTGQRALGLSAMGELRALNPSASGTSVVQAGETRLLRPYGLLPHPNVFAGVVLAGLLATLPAMIQRRRAAAALAAILFLTGLWGLCLSFSRSGWIAFGAGLLLWAAFTWRRGRRHAAFLAVVACAAVGVVFAATYQPLLNARISISKENTEMRSISDRLVYTRIAVEAVQQAPVQGIGAGNFPWYASYYLFYRTDYDLRGTNVHQIGLTVLAELGIVGMALFSAMLSGGVLLALLGRGHAAYQEKTVCLAIVTAYAAIGFVDHYPYTLFHTFVIWMGMLSMAINAADSTEHPALPHNHPQ